MRTPALLVLVIVSNAVYVFAQDAAQPSVNESPSPPPAVLPAGTPVPSPAPQLIPSPPPASQIPPSPAEPSQTPVLPELSALDQAFNQTGLGKDADEQRTRVEMRKLQNQVAREPEVMEAKAAANSARTDFEKREKLREYYNLNYGLMSKRATGSTLKTAIEQERRQHISLLAQPRVRPGVGESPVPTPAKKKHKKSGKKF